MSLWIEWNTEVEEALSKAENHAGEGVELDQEKVESLVTKAVEAALASENVGVPVEIGLQIVSAEEIREINDEYRQIDRVTDVLSFPLLDYEEEETPSERVQRALEEGEVDPETEEVCLGDIIICLQRAVEQAKEYGHSIEREVAFLSVHSVLHLLGYDHMVPEEEKVMSGKQEAVLESIGQTRNS